MKEARAASYIKTGALAFAATILAFSLVLFPKEALEASGRGLDMWWNVVFPSLLPFFIVSELLIGFGVVSFIGVILEPLMRPLFRVPGLGGFVWAMGLASGNPAGAKLAVQMRQQKRITRIEGERLAGFTNSSNPLFIFGAIAVGFFFNPALGMILALSHYAGNIMVGIVLRFYGKEDHQTKSLLRETKKTTLREAFHSLHQERLKDGRSIGKLLGDAVKSSIQTLLMIGGFIILFSVLNKLLTLIGVISLLAVLIGFLFGIFGLSPSLAEPFIAGLFEITIGAQAISQTTDSTFLSQIVIVSFILGFGGLSIQAQVASILADSDIRFRPFFYARVLHGVFSACLAVIFYKLFYNPQSAATIATVHPFPHPLIESWNLFQQLAPLITFFALISYFILKCKSFKSEFS
ncbi:sporulation integral membrane protein YlbJ [Alkalihalobacillus xiaoxiensis]|uniref:Sporulation integral membrane protein YlbJ n=1 Tax=Shouchella xiaoxiensis TaxID=766895 RepID=A0ABS2SPU8_9BACI|nr:sporulation integral membrane protein YlbJ [Shouchella xiaoxiensis]MBM7837538.1 sporulation integral membrane protein YlbJ [Shouchella xiaoxiensis]